MRVKVLQQIRYYEILDFKILGGLDFESTICDTCNFHRDTRSTVHLVFELLR